MGHPPTINLEQSTSILDKYFVIFYSVSLPLQYLSENILKKKSSNSVSLNDGHQVRC